MFDGFWGKSKKKEAAAVAPPLVEDGASKFTLPHLRNVHSQLMKMKADPGLNEVIVVESLRMIAEMVVYGDKKCEMLFDFFCEKNMLALFLEIMRAPTGCPTRVNIQILQTLSILCQCVRNNTSIYYLLSNNYINEIIDFPYDFEEEDGVCDNFISFMKSLSLRLNSQTVQFFFVEENDTFPLLSRAISFLHFKDPMVRTAAQATILNVLRIKEQKARDFSLRDDVLQAFASEIVLAFEAQHSTILALCLEYCAYTSHPNTRELTKGKVGSRIEDQLQNIFNGLEDWLYYMQDLFSLHVPKLTYVLSSQLTSQYIYPVLLDPFTRNQQWKYSDIFSTNKTGSKNVDIQNNIPPALNMDYFAKHASEKNAGDSLDDDTEKGSEDVPNELSREDSSVSLIVSIYMMNQILDIVREKRIRRSIMVALMHPLSQQQRKLVLNKARHDADAATKSGEDLSARDPMSESEAVSLLQIGFNSYRSALTQILASERDRFTLLACLLIEKFINLDVTECHERSSPMSKFDVADTIEYARNAVEPLSLLSMCAPSASYLPVKEGLEGAREENDSVKEDVGRQTSLTSIDDHEAWLASVKDSVQELSLPVETETRTTSQEEEDDERNRHCLDENHEPDQDDDGAFKGAARNGRRRGRSEDMNSGHNDEDHAEGSGLENVIYDADGISVKGMEVLEVHLQYIRSNYEDLECRKSNTNPYNCELDSSTMLRHILNLFGSVSMHSLVLLQTAGVVTYDLACLIHHANKPAPGSDVAEWRCPPDILECKAAVLSALQSTAQSLLLRANGWLSDTLLSQLEEEIRRSLGGEKKWINVLHKISRNLLLVLPPTKFLSKRLGLDHSTPTSQVESSRRELQTFLLLRSLYLCLSRLSSSPFAASSPQDLSESLVDEFIHIFSEHGGSSAPYMTGMPIEWGTRTEATVEACVVFPQLQSSTSMTSGGETPGGSFTPPPKSSKPSSSSPAPLTDTLVANGMKMKNKLSPIPKLVGNAVFRSGEKLRRIGEVVFIQDDGTLLLATPNAPNGDGVTVSGTVLLAVPLHRTDVVSDDDDARNIKLLVRSPVPIASMVCLSTPDSGGDTGAYDPLKMPSILSSRCPRVLYQMVIGFESKSVCDGVIKFIETQRLQIQTARTDSLKEMLGAWVDTTT